MYRRLLYVGLIVVVVLTGLYPTWTAGQVLLGPQDQPPPPSNPACELLDDPRLRGQLSGALETALLHECGREPAGPSGLGGDAVPAVAPPAGPDVRVNAEDPPVEYTVQSETSIAVNENTGAICSTFNDIYHYSQGNGTSGFSGSTDGGLTWQDGGPMPQGGGGVSRGDPSVAWRRLDGYFYYASLHTNGLSLYRSTDDCATFEYVGMIHTGDNDDKEFMAIDNYPSSPYYGRFYVAWADFSADARIQLLYSDDGVTWQGPVDLSTPGTIVQGAWPVVAPNGDVYVGWVHWNSYPNGPIDEEIVRSTDGGNTFAFVTNPLTGATNPRDVQATANCGRPALHGNIRYLPSPQLVVGPDGCLHVVYSYDPDGYGTGDVVNVYYRRSCDDGTSWGPEVLLNDDGGETDQFYPTITVNEDNVVAASWYDRRLDPQDNYLFDRYWTVSYDGGIAWEPNKRVSDVSSPVYIAPYTSSCYHGDYDQMASFGDNVYILWSDDRVYFNGHYDPDIWFDQASVSPDFDLEVTPEWHDACRPGVVTSTIDVGAINFYDQPVTLSDVGLPTGVSTAFALNPVMPLPGSSTYIITITASAADGDYAWTARGTSPTLTHAVSVSLVVNSATPISPTLLTPPDGSIDQPTRNAPFTWEDLSTATSYRFQIDDDPAFGSPEADVGGILTHTYILPGPLDPDSTYYWRVSATNGCGEGSFSAPFSFTTVSPCILLVDDDNNDPDVRAYYEDALAGLGYAFDIFDVGGGAADGPTLAEMQGYGIVIWFSGDKWSNEGEAGPNPTDEANLSTYLDSGGRLFLSSQSYLYDFGLTPFGEEYLGIGTYLLGGGDATSITGVAGDPIGDGLGPYPLTYPANFIDHGDRIIPTTTAFIAFEAQNGYSVAIDLEGLTWKTVFFGTSWVPVAENSPANGEELLGRIVEWFGACLCEPVEEAGFVWEPIAPAVGEVVTLTAWATSGWITETVDVVTEVDFTSLALDTSGRPHIAYVDYYAQKLKYAYHNGSAWQTEMVADVGEISSGGEPSLALDANDRPHIAYIDFGQDVLRYTWHDGTVWISETVVSGGRYVSLVLDATGRPHVSYYGGALGYAYHDGTTWISETVDGGGQYCSLALDSLGHPRISYAGTTGLKYARYDGEIWHSETVDDSEAGGTDTSLALDANDLPHVSYHLYPGFLDGVLKYAHHNGTDWISETVDSPVIPESGTSLALGQAGNPRISYFAGFPYYDLNYAYLDGSSWITRTLDSRGDVGAFPSLAIDDTDRPHISYSALVANGGLRYARLYGAPTPPVSYTWDLGDGAFARGEVVSHSYNLAGDYTVVLTVTNCGDISATAVHTITVLPVCVPVTETAFTWEPMTPTVGEVVTFTASASGTEPISYTWSLEAGELEVGKSITHVFTMTGEYTVTLTATNECGVEVAQHTVVVEVAPEPTWEIYLPIVSKSS
jgi:chitodextrinase